jgi:hypothetical protein
MRRVSPAIHSTKCNLEPELIFEGQGIAPIHAYLCGDKCDRAHRWNLQGASLNFFLDGVIYVSAAGKRNSPTKTCRRFEDFFEILYGNLRRSHKAKEINRVIRCAQLLEEKWQALYSAAQPNLSDESYEDIKASVDDTFASLFRRIYKEWKGSFDAVQAGKMVFHTNRLLEECPLPTPETFDGSMRPTTPKRKRASNDVAVMEPLTLPKRRKTATGRTKPVQVATLPPLKAMRTRP